MKILPHFLFQWMTPARLSGGKPKGGKGSGTSGSGPKGGGPEGSEPKGSGGGGSGSNGKGLDRLPETLRSRAQEWAELWGLPGMAESVTVEFSGRFRSSLGNCRPLKGQIRLAAHLENGNEDLLEEVLCHELAHVAVHRIYGRRTRPHGKEWKALVSAAGFQARARFERGEGRFPPRPLGKPN